MESNRQPSSHMNRRKIPPMVPNRKPSIYQHHQSRGRLIRTSSYSPDIRETQDLTPIQRGMDEPDSTMPGSFIVRQSMSMPEPPTIFQPWRHPPSQNLDSIGGAESEDIENLEDWERLKKWAASCVVVYAAYATGLISVAFSKNFVDRPISQKGDYQRQFFLQRLTLEKDEDCRNELRMGKVAFAKLVRILRDSGRLRDTIFSTVEEQIAKFLHIIGHNRRNWSVKLDYWRSGETVSRHFHNVLKAIISMEDIMLKQPNGSQCPPKIRNNHKVWPYFKDCIGALDGTHFRVKVSSHVVQRYRGRKCYPTQNVLAACSFDLKFTYVLPGWEGSASDSRILNNALTREIDRLVVPNNKYYLVDAGYQLKIGFLTPYRSTRYHLKEYSSHPPQNSQELFNLRHSSLRTAIERAFGVLKKRFPILSSGTEPFYPVETQANIVLAGCILHNYLMGVDPDERLIAEVDREMLNASMESSTLRSSLVEECREGEALREQIANAMWRDYNLGQN